MTDVEPFRVLRDDERTRVKVDGSLLGWGARFPSGTCIVEWNLEAYPPEDRLEHNHISQYGSVDDVEQGTGGRVEFPIGSVIEGEGSA